MVSPIDRAVRPKRRVGKVAADPRILNQELVIEQRKGNREKERIYRRQAASSIEQQEQQQQTQQQVGIQNQGTDSLVLEQPENQIKNSETSDAEGEATQEQGQGNSEIGTQRQYRETEDQTQPNDNNKNKNKNEVAEEESNNITGEKEKTEAYTPAVELAQNEAGMPSRGSRRGGGLSSLLGAIGIQPAAGVNSDNIDNNNNNNNNNRTNDNSRRGTKNNTCNDDGGRITLNFREEARGGIVDDEPVEAASRDKTYDVQNDEEFTEDSVNTVADEEKQNRVEWWRAAEKRARDEHETLKRSINEAQQQQQQQSRTQTEINSGTQQSSSLKIPSFEQRSYIFQNMNRVDYDAMCERVQVYNSQGGKKKDFKKGFRWKV